MEATYQTLLLIACIASAIFGTSILCRDFQQTVSRIAAAIVFGGAFWGFCEVLWNTSSDPERVLALVKLSALGWVGVGPLGLHLLLELVGDRVHRLRRLLPFEYAGVVAFLAIDWTTALIHPAVVRTSWGWSYELGPLYPLFYVLTVSSLGVGIWVATRAYRSWPSPAERAQARGIGLGISLALIVASITDGILPFLGHHVIHLGTMSIAGLGAIVAWTFYAHGDSLLSPRAFAREILETLPDGLGLLHLDGRIRHANPGLLSMMGCKESDLLGTGFVALVPGVVIEPGIDLRDHETVLQPLCGRPFPVALSTSQLRDRSGRLTGLIVLLRDLREVVALRERVVLSGRMAAVGQLAAGVAHEINNPMAYVKANLGLLGRHWAALERAEIDPSESAALWREGEELIEESIEGVERATTIIQDIKTFSHARSAALESTDLADLVRDVVRIAHPQTMHRAEIVFEAIAVPRVRCAPREIQQVLLNLVLNAVDAVADASQPVVTISLASGPEGVDVHVDDHGGGIASEDLGRIFDPFFTTKEAGRGTGLGLALSYEIMRRHGGEIVAESELGVGSRFTVRLPIAATTGDETTIDGAPIELVRSDRDAVPAANHPAKV